VFEGADPHSTVLGRASYKDPCSRHCPILVLGSSSRRAILSADTGSDLSGLEMSSLWKGQKDLPDVLMGQLG
jgi:hypothetical protein